MKTLSIIIPAYNSERTIADCIHSIKVQVLQPAFIIVVDDHSTDNTGKIAEDLGVYTRTNPIRVGKAASINSALDFVYTDYVLTLDSDTYLERDFIEKLSKILDSHDYDGGSGMVKYIGRNKFAKKVAKQWHSRSWKYNGCCQFFKTDVIKKLKFDENVYVEDEEIYQRMKKMKTAMVDVWAYTEVTHSRQQYVSQKYRWLRGDYQLMLRNKNILNIIIAGVSAFLPIFLFSVAFYFVKSNIVSTIYCIACMFLLGFVMSEESFDIKEIFNGMFIHTLVFIDVVILRSGMNLNNWTRDTPDTSK